eukprot:3976970-Alexandrium_andersonii.AAC.1
MAARGRAHLCSTPVVRHTPLGATRGTQSAHAHRVLHQLVAAGASQTRLGWSASALGSRSR